MHPRDATEIASWLRCYADWSSQLASGGMATAADGSRVQRGRVGDPTGSAAAWLTVYGERVRAVEQWLSSLGPMERRLTDHYLQKLPAVELGREYGLSQQEASVLVRAIPKLIWHRFYGAVERCS